MTWLEGDLLDPAIPLLDAGYDVITAVSSMHHMPLQPPLGRLAGLLSPGGVLAVVGLYKAATVGDYALELFRLPANAAAGAALAPRDRAGKPDDDGMPVLLPLTTLADVRPSPKDFRVRP